MAADPHPALAWLMRHRRRLAPLALVGGVLLVAGPLLDATPRSTSIRLKLAEPQQIRLVTLSVLDAGEPVLGLRLTYAQGAPDRIREELELAPGHYELRVDVTRAPRRDGTADIGDAAASGLTATSVRSLEVPAEGVVMFDLSQGDA